MSIKMMKNKDLLIILEILTAVRLAVVDIH